MEDEDDDDEQPLKEDGTDGATKKKKNRKKKKKQGKESESTDAGPKLEPVEEESAAALAAEQAAEAALAAAAPDSGAGATDGARPNEAEMEVCGATAEDWADIKADLGKTLAQAVEDGVVSTALSHGELVAIWDHLLMYYVLWLEGHTIVQTVFSCLYFQDLEATVKPMPLFAAFLDGFLVACREARNAILRAAIFDDEDFLPTMFGIDLESFAVHSTETGAVKERIDQACKSIKGDQSPGAKAVACRLEFMREYMLALHDFVSPRTSGSQARDPFSTSRRKLKACLDLVSNLSKTAAAGVPEVLQCFNPALYRKLLMPGPPRTVEPVRDSGKVFNMWVSHINELLLCSDLTQKQLMPLLDGAVTYKDEPNILPRSTAQLCVSQPGLLRTLILDSLDGFLLPETAQQHCESMEAFLEHSAGLFEHLLKLSYSNRARRFRRLAHVFTDFNSLQHRAWNLDEELKKTFGVNLRYPRPCWVWTMEHCLQMMLNKLFLGFDLELYDESEYHMIYWYADYLYGLRVYNLNELHRAKEEPSSDKKKGARPRQQQAAGRPERPKNPPPSLLLLDATQSAVRGLFRLLAFCLREGALKSPPAVMEGLAQRFVLRFRSLELFRLPHLPSFRDFQQSAASAQAPVESRVVLEAAQGSFSDASQLLDKVSACKERADAAVLDSAKALKRVVVANQLAITQLMKHLLGGSGNQPRVVAALAHHPHFVSVQIQAGG